jgi:uncharacterized protein with HEPN domain
VRSDVDRLLDMIEMCELLHRHASDPGALAADPVVQAAAQRWIEILGEAASHVSDETKTAYPHVRWREIIGTRIILAHAYFHIDNDIVRQVIAEDIPILGGDLRAIVSALAEQPPA